jgi:hypothetical protein
MLHAIMLRVVMISVIKLGAMRDTQPDDIQHLIKKCYTEQNQHVA